MNSVAGSNKSGSNRHKKTSSSSPSSSSKLRARGRIMKWQQQFELGQLSPSEASILQSQDKKQEEGVVATTTPESLLFQVGW